MKGACLLHVVLISSIRLLTVMNTPSLNTLARNPLIQCLRHSVPTPVFLDNPQSLTDPRFNFWISPPAPAHSGFVNELHSHSPSCILVIADYPKFNNFSFLTHIFLIPDFASITAVAISRTFYPTSS